MATLNELKASHATLFRELSDGEKKIKAGTLSTPEVEALEAKAQEAERIEAEIADLEAKTKRISAMAARGREVVDPVLPRSAAAPADEPETKAAGDKVLGYLSLGEAFVRSDEFKSYTEGGRIPPVGVLSQQMGVKSLHDGAVAVTERMLAAWEAKGATEGLELKAVPTIAAGVIQADRIQGLVRNVERPQPRMRDVLAVRGTTSNSIEYLAYSYTDAAAPVAESGLKPEAALTTSIANAPVRTLPVWIPVTEQQLQDVPQIIGIINQELVDDIKALEDRQILYGSGAGENLQGLLTLGGVPTIVRTVTNTQNVDRIFMGATDVATAGGRPNAFVIHPIDWEQIVLAKGTDTRYMFSTFTDPATGQQRIWGLTPVVTQGAKNPANAQRFLLVGDFVRGAQLHDRQAAAVQVGYVNDDFIRNKRTIRAEERVALTIQRPMFFAKYETNPAA